MPSADSALASREFAVEAHLLGVVDFETCLGLQQRLVRQTIDRDDGRITLLICEHPPTLTIGRGGSRAHFDFSPEELASRNLAVHWLNRGGGCLLHLPGQLAVYPIVPLAARGWTVGEYLARLQAGLLAALAERGAIGSTQPERHGIWGRTGQLVAVGAAVKHWVAYHGAFINVSPGLHLFRRINSDPRSGAPMSSLVVETQKPVKMAAVRAGLVRQLAAAFDCERYHLHTGHPELRGKANRGMNVEESKWKAAE